MKISGFTFVHNGIEGGFPFVQSISAVRPYVDEVIAVDIESTDGTFAILDKLCDKVLTSSWDGRDTTPRAFMKHTECKGDIVIFFEADEVYDDSLLSEVMWAIERGHDNLAVWRIQVECNFQKVRQYPIPVHRIFPKGGGSYHIHPTNLSDNPRYSIYTLPPDAGYLWDVSNCFRDNWFTRKQNQSEIWGEPRSLMVAEHFTEPVEIGRIEEENRLQQPCWQWTHTPLNIPAILLPLVGVTRYDPKL
jgi:hypothetical protein